jgi:hypothetical protein
MNLGAEPAQLKVKSKCTSTTKKDSNCLKKGEGNLMGPGRWYCAVSQVLLLVYKSDNPIKLKYV